MKLLALGIAAGVAATPTLAAPAQAAAPTAPAPAVDRSAPKTRTVTVFGHRGASGYRPEHTLASYQLAIDQGADVVEPDLVSTKDGVLVARHENEIGGTTDVAEHSEFADRRTTKTIDGLPVTGWFTEDFTYDELRTLRAKERLPAVRPGNTVYDGKFTIPTFDEVVALAKRESRRLGRRIAVAPETKHPTYFRSIGLPLEEPLLRSLQRAGWTRPSSPVVVQSFEVTNLQELSRRTKVQLVQLTSATGAPYDLASRGDATTYADLMSPAGLRAVSRYAQWLGPEKSSVIPRDASGRLTVPTRVVRDAHRAGLKVTVYTFRAENTFLPTEYREGTDPAGQGDLAGEITRFLDAGVDGVFSDFPDTAVRARDDWARRR
ncbi:MAG: glycerophosphodiester phosphodiesterase [Aeromicrobium erythreum]